MLCHVALHQQVDATWLWCDSWMQIESTFALQCNYWCMCTLRQTELAKTFWKHFLVECKCHSMTSLYIWPGSLLTPSPYCCVCVCVCLYTTWFPKTAEKVLGVAIESSYYPIYLARHDRTSACLVDSLLAEDTTLNHITTESWLASCLVFARRNLVRALNSHQHQGFLMKKYWEPRRDWRRLNQLYELMCHQSQQQEIHSIICAENQRCANEK